ncbi:MAG: phosphate/phosphite/phosphonate ABC transporter substrate-binding protein, partial [Limnospira sp.]
MLDRRSFMGLALLFLVSCTATTQTALFAPLGGDGVDSLKFAVTDVQGLDDLERDYEAFRAALEVALEREIEFYPVDSYTEAVSALQLGTIDIALTGPSEYVLIQARTNAIPVIAITRLNYHSAIAVPASSPVKTVADLKGKTIAMLKVGSTSGHLGPTEMLMEAGLDPKTDYKVKMLGREGSLKALKSGEVEAWGGPVIDYEQFLQEEGLSEADFFLLKKGPQLPNDVFVVNSNTDPQLIELWRDRAIARQQDLIAAL